MIRKRIKKKKELPDFAIALAWPQTLCKQAGGWYDVVMKWFGINRNYFYRAGHAAIVIINSNDGVCHYFDFGRYHAPFAYGRVRSADTDHELEMKTRAVFSEDKTRLLNQEEILHELSGNDACHGSGPLYGAVTPVNFSKAYDKALDMQQKSPWPYGPFVVGGTNCSRFVRTILLKGITQPFLRFKVRFAVPYTPTPLNNVKNLGKYMKVLPGTFHSGHLNVNNTKTVSYA